MNRKMCFDDLFFQPINPKKLLFEISNLEAKQRKVVFGCFFFLLAGLNQFLGRFKLEYYTVQVCFRWLADCLSSYYLKEVFFSERSYKRKCAFALELYTRAL